jgi:hypothetical protein
MLGFLGLSFEAGAYTDLPPMLKILRCAWFSKGVKVTKSSPGLAALIGRVCGR